MKLTSLRTKNNIEIPIGKFTVLVGPNNVGKSQTLKDIHSKMVSGQQTPTTIVDHLEIEKPATFEELLVGLKVFDDPKHMGQKIVRGIGSNLRSGDEIRINYQDIRSQFDRSPSLDFTFGNISKYRVSYLDASSRLQVAQSVEAHNPHTQAPQNLLQGLFSSEGEIENTLRSAFGAAFGMDIRLDYSGMTRLCMRVAKEFGDIDPDPRKAYSEFRNHVQLDNQGDGFRSFVGVVLSLLLSEGRVVLLDEPEAFLHPAQARQLGYWIATHAGNVPGQIIVATHNANFLSGILTSGQEVDIYRINRQEDNTTYTRISPEATLALATSPILSSQRVLEAIFHKGVVVCEADSDRAVYQTVAAKSLSNQDMLFIHAHNKQTIPRVVSLLKNAEIPVCAIVDMDILNSIDEFRESFQAFRHVDDGSITALQKKLSENINKADSSHVLQQLSKNLSELNAQLGEGKHGLAGARGALNRIKSEVTAWHDLKLGGLNNLDGEPKQIVEQLINISKSFGLFIVPVGQLEGWITLGTTQKNKWIVLALESINDGNIPDKLVAFVRDNISFLGSQ